MKILVLVGFISSLLFSFNFNISDTAISNGATSLIEFNKENGLKYEKLTLGKKSFKVYQHPTDKTKMYALLPISYYEKPSDKMVDIYYKENGSVKNKSISVKIKDGKYKKEKIQVTKSKVNPHKKYNDRISKEYHEAMKIYGTSTKENYLSTEFMLPLDSFITSDFGKARVYNDTLKGYHSGTDFRAKVGTPIVASNDGVVVLAKDRFYAGGTVLIDHGQGVYTCYYHMSKFDVKVNQKIKKGKIIGLSGKSGRVSGPHLHFGVRVGGVQVDPLQFLALMNKNLLNKEEK
ncbi:MAG: M23 family metallopeptidase [Sulfurimonas sp.]|nr:M23 family metallopeptidase [Sulfurimonas sp.]